MKIKEAYNPEETRSQILQAAFKEIYVYGFQAASLKRILENVNHSKGALYHHFPNKKELGLSVINEMIGARMYSFFMKPLEGTDNPIPVLCDIFQKKTDTLTIQEIKYGCPLNNLTQEMASIDKDFYDSLKIISDKWILTIEQSLKRDQTCLEKVDRLFFLKNGRTALEKQGHLPKGKKTWQSNLSKARGSPRPLAVTAHFLFLKPIASEKKPVKLLAPITLGHGNKKGYWLLFR